MKMYVNGPSPYARRALMTAMEKGLDDRIEVIETDPWSNPAEFHAASPVGRLPALVTDDGRTICESFLVMLYLDDLDGSTSLQGPDRTDVLSRAGVAQGIIDSVYFAAIENRRPEDKRWSGVKERQWNTVERTLKVCRPSDGGFDLADITLAAALGYLDFRLGDFPWRDQRPDLADWFAGVASRRSFAETRPDRY